MFSNNIIERHNALADLLRSGTSFNFINVYVVGVTILLAAAWRLSKWL